MARFEARTFEGAGETRVVLSGDCDLSVRDELLTVLDAALTAAGGSHPRVVVDLAEVGFLDSTGVHGLITAHHAALGRHGRLVVVNAKGAVAAVLDITGVAGLLSDAAPPAVERRTGG
ncbi:STAS domain-containing protein [Actinoplanes sp. NPDC048796]|uniref:STAS domain-containing protein n=1 Tax=unclassified Actinoplanes TaxID=2626549 RepID=UPI0033EBBBCA